MAALNDLMYTFFNVFSTKSQKLPITTSGADIIVPTDQQAIYRDQANSTTTPLGVSATYTGATIDGIQFRRLTGYVFADQGGTLNLQHSLDGVTWSTLTTISVTANSAAKFDEPFYARYARLQYVNGATAQGTFALVAYRSVV